MLPPEIHWTPGMTLKTLNRQCIEKCMEFYHGNKTQVALSLGISIRTLHNKICEFEEENAKIAEEVEHRARIRENHLMRSRGIPESQWEDQRRIMRGLRPELPKSNDYEPAVIKSGISTMSLNTAR